MSRPAAAAGVAALLLVAAVASVRHRSGADPTSAVTARPAAAYRARTREFWEAYRRATDHRMAGDPAAAVASYVRALDLDPHHEDALYYLGNMYLALDRTAEARAAWERLVAVNPQSSRAHSRLGDLYLCPGSGRHPDLALAEAEFRRAHEINREETGPVLRLGEIALIRDDVAEAQYYLDAVIGAHAGSVEAHFLRGYVAWRGRDSVQAWAFYAKARELSRPADTAGAMPGEGDTRRGTALVISQATCDFFRPDVAELTSGGMAAHYQRLLEAVATLNGSGS